MSTQYDSRTADKFVVRLPDGLRADVERAAGECDTSMNTVFVQALRQYLDTQQRQKLLLDALSLAAIRKVPPCVEQLERDLTAADERADALEQEVKRLNRVKLALNELAESRSENCSVYRQHLSEALTMAENVRDASLGMQRKCLSDLIDYLRQNGAAPKPAEVSGSTCNQIREESGLPTNNPCQACGHGACIDR